MDDIESRTNTLRDQVAEAMGKLHIPALAQEYEQLRNTSEQVGFWEDSTSAQDAMKRLSKLEARISPWQKLDQSVRDTYDLAALGDTLLIDELRDNITSLEQTFVELKDQLKFSAHYDDFDAIISIHAGAGGTDAQDWAQMVYRMYARWAEAHAYSLVIDDESAGEEAGLKSITFEISGEFIYGKLKGEHGVHRLVRLSPFNADNLRQTSFVKVEVMPKIDRPDAIVIDDKDLKIDVYRSGGHGGQSVNTTDSAVRVTHLPTGIVVAIQNERSQLQNKETALTILRSRLAQLQTEQHLEHLSDLKGPNEQAAWGNQIRSYVLHPYKQVKDLRTRYETSDPDKVLDGDLDSFIDAYLEHIIGQ